MTPVDKATIENLLAYTRHFEGQGKTFKDFADGWDALAGDIAKRAFAPGADSELTQGYIAALSLSDDMGFLGQQDMLDEQMFE